MALHPAGSFTWWPYRVPREQAEGKHKGSPKASSWNSNRHSHSVPLSPYVRGGETDSTSAGAKLQCHCQEGKEG